MSEANSVLVKNPVIPGEVGSSSTELAMDYGSKNHMCVSLHDVRCDAEAKRAGC